jgi:cell wall-associated NlpC family hydrolase
MAIDKLNGFNMPGLDRLSRDGIPGIGRNKGAEKLDKPEKFKKDRKRPDRANFRNIGDRVSFSDELREELGNRRQVRNERNNQTNTQTNTQTDGGTQVQVNGENVTGADAEKIVSSIMEKVQSMLSGLFSKLSEKFGDIFGDIGNIFGGQGQDTPDNPAPTETPAAPPTTTATPPATAPTAAPTETTLTDAPAGSSDAVQKILGKAMEWEGKHYRQGVEKQCSEWVSEVIFESGGAPEGFQTVKAARQLDKYGQDVSRDQLQPGDLVFFNGNGDGPFSHVGIYVGDGKYIHRPNGRTEVKVDKLGNSFSKGKRIV